MSLFGFSLKPRRPKTAQMAKDRLLILLAQERGKGSQEPDYLPAMQNDILAVIRKHMKIADDAVDIRMERRDDISSLEINIEMPAQPKRATPTKRRPR
jgi:cell division topological specificity factor